MTQGNQSLLSPSRTGHQAATSGGETLQFPSELMAARNPEGSEYFRNQKQALRAGKVYCHACDGYGQVRFRFGPRGSKDWKRCETCNGKGQLDRERPQGSSGKELVLRRNVQGPSTNDQRNSKVQSEENRKMLKADESDV